MSALAEAGVGPAEVHGPAPGAPSLEDFFLSEWTSTPFTELTDPNVNQNPSGKDAGDFARIILNAYAGGLQPGALSAESERRGAAGLALRRRRQLRLRNAR